MAKIPRADPPTSSSRTEVSGNINTPAAANISGARPFSMGRVRVVDRGPGVFARQSGVLQDPNAMTAHLRGMEQAAQIKAQAARQISGIGEQLTGFALRSLQAKNAADLVEAESIMDAAFDEYRGTLGADPTNWLKGWQDTRKGLIDELSKREDLAPEVRRQLEYNTKGWAAKTDLNLKLMADKRQISYAKTRLLDGHDRAVNRGDLGTAAEIRQAGMGTGLLGEDEVLDLERRTEKQVEVAELQQRLQMDPRGLLRDLEAKSTAPGFDEQATTSQERVKAMVKGFERFAPQAQWDYQQYTVGWGTRGQKGETITEAEAETRLEEELGQAFSQVQEIADQGGYEFTEREMEALVSFQFNTGAAKQLLLDNGQRSKDEIVKFMKQYTKAGGKELPGLVTRRGKEAAHFMGAAPESTGEGYQHYPSLTPVDRQRMIGATQVAIAEQDSQDAEQIADFIEAGEFMGEADIIDALNKTELPATAKTALHAKWANQKTDFEKVSAVVSGLVAYDAQEDATGKAYHDLRAAIATYAPAHARADLNAILDAKEDPSSDLGYGIGVMDEWFKGEGRIYKASDVEINKARMDAYKMFRSWLDRQENPTPKEIHEEAVRIARFKAGGPIDPAAPGRSGVPVSEQARAQNDMITLMKKAGVPKLEDTLTADKTRKAEGERKVKDHARNTSRLLNLLP